MKFKSLLIASTITLLSVNSATAQAQNIWCSGKLAGVYITASGDVVINGSWRNNWTRICNLNDGTVNTVVCSLWASYAATARQNNLHVRLMYSNASTSCAELPTYSNAPIPSYVMLEGP